MKISGIKINNYKSFGENGNLIRFDSERVLALIGKNESGKSNTIKALEEISFFKEASMKSTFSNMNRNLQNEVSISIDITFDKEDLVGFKYKKESTELKSGFVFYKKNNSIYMDFDGILANILKTDKELEECANEILNINFKYDSNESTKNTQRIIKDKLTHYTSTYIKTDILGNYYDNSQSTREIIGKFKELLDQYYSKFIDILLNIIVVQNDLLLKNEYTISDLKDNNKNTKELEYLLNSISFSKEELINWLETSDQTRKTVYDIRFKENLKLFSTKFNKYYRPKENEQIILHANTTNVY